MQENNYPIFATNDDFVDDLEKDVNPAWRLSPMPPILKNPAEIDMSQFLKDEDLTRAGEYTLNPEMQSFTEEDFEKMAKERRIKVMNPFNTGRSDMNNIRNVTILQAAQTLRAEGLVSTTVISKQVENIKVLWYESVLPDRTKKTMVYTLLPNPQDPLRPIGIALVAPTADIDEYIPAFTKAVSSIKY